MSAKMSVPARITPEQRQYLDKLAQQMNLSEKELCHSAVVCSLVRVLENLNLNIEGIKSEEEMLACLLKSAAEYGSGECSNQREEVIV